MDKRDFVKLLEEIQERERIFWEDEYSNYDLSEKKSHWLRTIHRDMRTQGETVGDEYSLFSKKTYETWKETELDFDLIFSMIVKELPNFDWQEYQRRIQE